jgi:hypothetical protein
LLDSVASDDERVLSFLDGLREQYTPDIEASSNRGSISGHGDQDEDDDSSGEEDMRIVQLVLTPDEHDRFLVLTRTLGERFGTTTISATVLHILEVIARDHAEHQGIYATTSAPVGTSPAR